jgi:nicotinate-nucleotide adenylyltransferase
MNIGLFGGTFDPIHLGHLALARTAQERFQLGRIQFVPASLPPHRAPATTASYFHRYAMVALATSGQKGFSPSLLEAPDLMLAAPTGKGPASAQPTPGPNYSIDSVRKLKSTLGKSDRLFFLIGMDAFEQIAQWREPEALLAACEFIVASRAGYSLADVANALPENLRPAAAVCKPFARQPAKGDLVLSAATIHLLDGLHHPASATAIRQAVAAKRPLGRLLDPAVADYIKKMGLYGSGG